VGREGRKRWGRELGRHTTDESMGTGEKNRKEEEMERREGKSRSPPCLDPPHEILDPLLHSIYSVLSSPRTIGGEMKTAGEECRGPRRRKRRRKLDWGGSLPSRLEGSGGAS